MTQSAITTIDNPYDPFTEFKQWYMFDVENGYDTCAYLARLTNDSSDKFTDEENFQFDEMMIDRIIEVDPFNIYKKVQREVKEEEIHI